MKIIYKSMFFFIFICFLNGYVISQEYTILNRSFEENQIVISGAPNTILIAGTGRTITGTIKSENLVLSSGVFISRALHGNILTDFTPEESINMNYSLSQNYPNPFNPSTKIKFTVAELSNVNVTIYNVLGQRITVLVDGVLNPGEHETTWNANNFSNGVYLCVMRSGDFMDSKKIILLK